MTLRIPALARLRRTADPRLQLFVRSGTHRRAIAKLLADHLPPLQVKIRRRMLDELARRIAEREGESDLYRELVGPTRVAATALHARYVVTALEEEHAAAVAQFRRLSRAHDAQPTPEARQRLLAEHLRRAAPDRWRARADQAALRRHLDLAALKERHDAERHRLLASIELLLAFIAGALHAVADANEARALLERSDLVAFLSGCVGRSPRWQTRRAALLALEATIRIGDELPPATLDRLRDRLDEPNEHPWVAAAVIDVLWRAAPELAKSITAQRLLRPGDHELDFLVRRLLLDRVDRDDVWAVGLLEELVTRDEPTEHVRIGIAVMAPRLLPGHPEALEVLAQLGTSAEGPGDGSARVRAHAAKSLVGVLGTLLPRLEPGNDSRIELGSAPPLEPLTERALELLRISLEHERDPLPLLVMCEDLRQQAQRLADEHDRAFAALDRLVPALVELSCTDGLAAAVHEEAAATLEALDRIRSGPRRNLVRRLRAALEDTRVPGSCRVPLPHDAATPTEVGRALAELTRDDWGVFGSMSRRTLWLHRGDRFATKLWRVLHELRHPAPNKRQGFRHTIGRTLIGDVRAHSGRLDEVTPTVVPGERVTIRGDGGWGRHIPTADDAGSLPVLRPRPVEIYSSFGVTRLRPARSLVRRLWARLRLVRRYPEVAAQRSISLDSPEPEERRRYLTMLRDQYGVEVEFEPPPPTAGHERRLPGRITSLLPAAPRRADAAKKGAPDRDEPASARASSTTARNEGTARRKKRGTRRSRKKERQREKEKAERTEIPERAMAPARIETPERAEAPEPTEAPARTEAPHKPGRKQRTKAEKRAARKERRMRAATRRSPSDDDDPSTPPTRALALLPPSGLVSTTFSPLQDWLQTHAHYFLSIQANQQDSLAAFFVGAFGLFLGESYRRRRAIDRARASIPLSIGGWGTRGKSGTERIKAGLFHGLGYQVFSKTTGCEAMMIHSIPEGPSSEIFVFRPYGKATIWEQRTLLQLGAALRCDVFLWECMALNPKYVQVLQHKWMRDDLCTLTNAYPDHEDIQGPSGIDVASTIACFIPPRGKVITSEINFLPLFREVCQRQRSTMVALGNRDGDLIARELLDLFPYQEHPRNIALVATMAEELGIDRELAIVTMAQHVVPDLGVLKSYPKVRMRGRVLEFINGCSANERAGFMANWDRTGCAALAGSDDPEQVVITVVNNRDDRISRSEVFARILVNDTVVDRHVLIGTNLRGLQAFVRGSLAVYLPNVQIVRPGDLEAPEGAQRTSARLATLMRRLRIPAPEPAALLRCLSTYAAGCGLELAEAAAAAPTEAALATELQRALQRDGSLELPKVLHDLEHDRALQAALEQGLRERPASGPDGLPEVLGPCSRNELHAHFLRQLARSVIHARLARQLDALHRDRRSDDVAAFEGRVREAYRVLFEDMIVVVEDPKTKGDAIVQTCARCVPPGTYVRIMGTQNIKGTGLDFVYRWLAIDAVLGDLRAHVQAADVEGKIAALERIIAFADHGVVDLGLLMRFLDEYESQLPAERPVLDRLRSKVEPDYQRRKATLDALVGGNAPADPNRKKKKSNWREPLVSWLEGWLDFLDGARRYHESAQIMKDLVTGRIAHPKAAVLMREIYAREKGGWLLRRFRKA
ncbi:hypothetical protein [Paraliomyxa miuraensis]|uniref:hypothetical protein n=1 Tax=Paraliomyxa miuraensis TaxID=376150 RepID=UPI00225A5720|nr:hypothetical protein [Paraliomyxa miuraensis]MCX4245298.1 hypothetical protein [Paraliomyxa miuraensis]